MTKVKAVKDGKEVFGTHVDNGLVESKHGPVYQSVFTFENGHVITVDFAKDLAKSYMNSAEKRHEDSIDILRHEGYTALEIIDG